MPQAAHFAQDFITSRKNVRDIGTPSVGKDGTVTASGIVWQEHVDSQKISLGFFGHRAEFTVKTDYNDQGEIYAKTYSERVTGPAINGLWRKSL